MSIIETIEKDKVSFPKQKPICCGKKMYPCGGTVGEIREGDVMYWRCEKCGTETTDIAS